MIPYVVMKAQSTSVFSGSRLSDSRVLRTATESWAGGCARRAQQSRIAKEHSRARCTENDQSVATFDCSEHDGIGVLEASGFVDRRNYRAKTLSEGRS